LTVYADTSVFVSLYVADRHSAAADQLLRAGPRLWATSLHIAEWSHALAQLVFRGHISSAEADRAHQEFEKDIAAGVWLGVSLPESAWDVCAALARRYGPKLGVRTLDSLHVACALELQAEEFWTFDDRQRKLAKATGLLTR
jgi:predicted nucleic acid-binding protein